MQFSDTISRRKIPYFRKKHKKKILDGEFKQSRTFARLRSRDRKRCVTKYFSNCRIK